MQNKTLSSDILGGAVLFNLLPLSSYVSFVALLCMLFTKLFNCLKGLITNTPRYIHTLETHYRLELEMVRIRIGKSLAHKLSVSEGWYLFAEVNSRKLSLNVEFAVWQ